MHSNTKFKENRRPLVATAIVLHVENAALGSYMLDKFRQVLTQRLFRE